MSTGFTDQLPLGFDDPVCAHHQIRHHGDHWYCPGCGNTFEELVTVDSKGRPKHRGFRLIIHGYDPCQVSSS